MTTENLPYRRDIDGLRAIAVMLVVGFHGFPVWVKSGFMGVDIFFVISGYLITRNILSNLSNKTFTIAGFYRARIRRIFPALIVVLAFSLGIGWFYLFADELAALGRQTLFGSLFLANFLYWSESGYFGGEAISKPLLHLWSLSVEEQFYLIWPIALLAVWRRNWSIKSVFLSLIIFSFLTNIYLSYSASSAAFFWPATRFWELMAGGALSYINSEIALRRRVSNINTEGLALLGLILLVIAFALINSQSVFPGFWALLPTLATVFLIAAGPSATFNRVVLSSKPLVYVGLISYPLYLWHWVILSLLSTVYSISSREIRLGAIAVAFFLSWLTYTLVEKPIRYGSPRTPVSLLLLGSALIGFVGLITWQIGGFEGMGLRSSEKTAYANYFSGRALNLTDKTPSSGGEALTCNFYDLESERKGLITLRPIKFISIECLRPRTNGQKTLFLWGDSHAEQLYAGLNDLISPAWGIMHLTSYSCAPTLGAVQSNTNYCEQSNWLAYKTIAEEKPEVVVIAQLGNHSAEQMSKMGHALKDLGVRKVIFVGPTPHWNKPLYKIVLRNLWEDTPERTLIGLNMESIVSDAVIKQKFVVEAGLHYVSIIERYCNPTQGCLVYLGSDRKLDITTRDSHHLSSGAAKHFVQMDLFPIIVSSSD